MMHIVYSPIVTFLKHRSLRKNNAGVSMTELAIVITVIALLVGVVVGGRSIKKASEIRGMVSDIQQFQSSIENFRTQYNGLPGDLNDATEYFSTTVNGNGNGAIEYPEGGNIESLRAWQQLNLAGLVEGEYTGIATVGAQADIGGNVPSSRRNKVGYLLITDNLAGKAERLEFRIGAFVATNRNDAAALTPQEAKSLDAKIDDGYPLAGTILAAKGSDITSDVCLLASGEDYRVADDNISCILAFPALP